MVTARRRWSASANSPGEEVAGTSVVTSEREKGKTGCTWNTSFGYGENKNMDNGAGFHR